MRGTNDYGRVSNANAVTAGAGVGGAVGTLTRPQFLPLPDAPPALPTLPVPIWDQGAADAAREKAANLANLPVALAQLFGIGGGAAERGAPALLGAALSSADAGTLQRFGINVDQYQMQQGAQNIDEARRQRAYAQGVDSVQGANKAAQQGFDNNLDLQKQAELSAYHADTIGQRKSAAELRAEATYRRSIFALAPDAQEAELLNSPTAKQFDIKPQYDEAGNYIPIQTQKDVTGQQNADTRTSTGANQNEYRDAMAGVATGRLGNDTQRTANNTAQVGINDKVANVRIAKMAADTKIAQQRANDYHKQVETSVKKINAALTGLGKQGKDPGTALIKIDKEISAAMARRAKTNEESKRSRVSYNPDTKALFGGSVDADTKLIQAARIVRNRIVQQMQIAPAPSFTLSPSEARRISGKAATKQSGTVGPAKIVVKPLTAESARNMSTDELKKIMLGGVK